MSFLESIDKNRLQKILLVTIAALVLALLVCLVVIIISGITPPAPTPNGTDFELKDYTLTDKDVNTGTLVLADEDHRYSVDASLLDLVECRPFRDEQMTAEGISDKPYLPYLGMMLNKTAMTAAHNMLSDAKKGVAGGKAITVDAAHSKIVHGGSQTEEYNTGLVLFLSDNASEKDSYKKLGNDYIAWFNSNAAKYGFIKSFDDAYRYVGEVHANYITENKITLADYIEFLKNNTSAEKAITVKLGDAEYSVYYAEGKAGDTVKVPSTAEYTVSGTNEGGVIVTVKTK